MKGWGSVACLIVLGLSIASGCGSRTGGFEDFYYGVGDDDDDSVGGGTIGGMSGAGGKVGTSGSGTGGKKPIAGRGGASGSGTGGTIPIAGSTPIAGTVGVAGFGGTGVAGFGGTGFGGFGGFGGFFGGAAGFGAVPIGGFGGEPQSCQSCLLDSCSAQFIQCLQDVGCIEIIACAQRSGCQGLDCYDAGTCKKVIDRWGGPAGSSMNEVLQTVGCAVNAGGPCN